MFPQVQVKWGREKVYLEIGLANPEKKPIRFYNENMRLQRKENVGIIQIPMEKIVESCIFDTPNTHIQEPTYLWHRAGTSIYSDRVKLVF